MKRARVAPVTVTARGLGHLSALSGATHRDPKAPSLALLLRFQHIVPMDAAPSRNVVHRARIRRHHLQLIPRRQTAYAILRAYHRQRA